MDDERRQKIRKRKSTRRSFYREAPTTQFKKGDTIFLQDQSPKHVYVIKSGVVEEYNINESGDYRSISFELTGSIIPKCWAFSKTIRTTFYYRAHTDCELYIVQKKDFLRELNTDVVFANRMLDRAINSLIGAKLQIDALEKPRSDLKLLYIMRCFMIAYGKKVSDDIVKIQIPLTQQEIANFTGLTRETVTIKIDIFKKQKVLSCKDKYYSVNINKLNDLIDDKYNLEE